MKIEIRYPYIYEQLINNRQSMWNLKEYNYFKKQGKKFEKTCKKYINKIIKLIEKYTKNKKWQYSFIPIYLISEKNYKEGTWKAFSDPLTIRLFKNKTPEELLKILVHELIHVNLSEEVQLSRTYKTNEKIVKEITNKVWEELGIKCKSN
jgi:hypothetical protein